MSEQVVSKKRVADHGEVYTSKKEVNAMLDLIEQETERIESRFLEPACGTGNFLVEILRRKLNAVADRYHKNQIEFEKYAVITVSSIYGIDILEDNVLTCRNRLYYLFEEKYRERYQLKVKKECFSTIHFLLQKNIIHGNALDLKTIGPKREPIVFSEWSAIKNSIKRRDYTYEELLTHDEFELNALISDEGNMGFIAKPVKEYPLTHFLRIRDV